MRINLIFIGLLLSILLLFPSLIYAESPKKPVLLSPLNGSITSEENIFLEYFIQDNDADPLNVRVFGSYNDSRRFQTIDFIVEEATNTYLKYNWNGLINGKYYWKVLVSDGFNRPYSDVNEFTIIDPLLEISPEISFYELNKGQEVQVNLTITSINSTFDENLTIMPIEPIGYGIVINESPKIIQGLNSGESKSVTYNIKALRSNEANLMNNWIMKFRVTDGIYYEDAVVEFKVNDLQPGKLFYLMTADAEIRKGTNGLYTDCTWTDGDSGYDSDESWLTMITKPKIMNNVAKPNGAKWTFHYCVGCLTTLKQSEILSTTGNWTGIYNSSKDILSYLVYNGDDLSPHTHVGKDYSHKNTNFTWNESDDAFYQGNGLGSGQMDEVYPNVGNFTPNEYNTSKTAYIYDHLSFLERYGRLGDPSLRILSYRTGGHQAGDGISGESKTIETQLKLKLLSNSDHDGNLDSNFNAGVPYGENLFLTSHGDINSEVKDLRNVALLEAAPTPQPRISYEFGGKELGYNYNNDKIDEGVEFYTDQEGNILPGVHFIMGMTHPFQMCGTDENGIEKYWELEGGDFEGVYNHTKYINETYPEIKFSGFSEATLEYLDYYSPELIALRSTEYSYLSNNPLNQKSKYEIKFIGKDILIDENHQHEVSVKYPSYFMNFVNYVELYRNNQIEHIYNFGSDDYYPDMNFTVNNSNDNWYIIVNQSRNEFPYIVSDNFNNEGALFLNLSSPFNFLRMNMIIEESLLKFYNTNYNLENITLIDLKLEDGTVININNYLIDGEELTLKNITIQESTSGNQLRIFFNNENSCSVMLDLFNISMNSREGDENYDIRIDVNNDGVINLVDVSIFSSHFDDNAWCSKILNKNFKIISPL